MKFFYIILPLIFVFLPFTTAFAQEGVDGGESPDAVTSEGFSIVPEVCRGDGAATECGYEELVMLVKNIIALLLYLAIFVGFLLFVYAGFLYLTNTGNPSRISQAKTIFWNVVIGLAIAFAAYLIVEVVVTTLGVCEGFNPFTGIDTESC